MPSGSDLQDSVDRTREAFRRSSTDGQDPVPPRHIPARGDVPVPDGRGGDVTELHPFFQGLLDTLPEPGTDWPKAGREQWLETARNIFALIYHDATDAVTPLRLLQPPQNVVRAQPRFDEQSA